jgi:hypothetical protein
MEIHVDKTKYMLLSPHQSAGRHLAQFRHFRTRVRNQNLVQEETEF